MSEKRTMRTIEVVSYGEHQWRGPEHAARIERARVLFSDKNRVKEVLKFCYLKGGRHARTHLTIDPEEFVDLFQSAVEAGVFPADVLKELFKVLKKSQS
jgi:hypothetical protein